MDYFPCYLGCNFTCYYMHIHTHTHTHIYAHTHTVPDGPGKGTVDALNGLRATDYLSRAERLSRCAQPFAWVLFRAPWAPGSLCCKASVCHQMKVLCEEAEEVCVCVCMHVFVCLYRRPKSADVQVLVGWNRDVSSP